MAIAAPAKKYDIEPFEAFVTLYPGVGKPFLSVTKNPKTWHIHWGDGDLRRYIEFPGCLDKHAMNAALKSLFEQVRHRLGTKSILSCGGCNGVWTYCPADIAPQVYEIVKVFFTTAAIKAHQRPSWMEQFRNS